MNRSKQTALLLGMLVLAAGFTGIFALWYWQSGDTSRVLAALVEQTPTPSAQATAPASPNQTARKRTLGIVQSIQDRTVTVRDVRGVTRTFQTNAQTQFIVVGKPNAGIADLQVHDKVLVLDALPKDQAASNAAPRAIIAVPSTYKRENILMGRLQPLATSQWTLTNKKLSKTISMNNDAQIFGAGLTPATRDALAPNVPALVLGEPNGSTDFNARIIVAFPNLKTKNVAQALITRARLESAFGTVTGINGITLQLQPVPADAQTLALDANTRVIAVNKPNATVADIQAGDKLVALGAPLNAAKLRAPRAVIILPGDYTRANFAFGKVISLQNNQWVVKTLRGNVTVSLDAFTQFFDQTLNSRAPDNLENQIVVVIGKSSGDSMQAQIILARAKP